MTKIMTPTYGLNFQVTNIFHTMTRKSKKGRYGWHFTGHWENKVRWTDALLQAVIISNYWYNLGAIHRNRDLTRFSNQTVTDDADPSGPAGGDSTQPHDSSSEPVTPPPTTQFFIDDTKKNVVLQSVPAVTNEKSFKEPPRNLKEYMNALDHRPNRAQKERDRVATETRFGPARGDSGHDRKINQPDGPSKDIKQEAIHEDLSVSIIDPTATFQQFQQNTVASTQMLKISNDPLIYKHEEQRIIQTLQNAGFHRNIQPGDYLKTPYGKPGGKCACAYTAPYPHGRHKINLPGNCLIGPVLELRALELPRNNHSNQMSPAVAIRTYMPD